MLSIEPLSLSLSLFHSPRFLLLPVVAIYFTSLRRYRKLFAALASTGGHPRGIRSADHPRGEREIGRVKISRVPRPRDYGISGPMVIYDGPRREGKKKRYSNEHASSNRYILSSSSSSAFSPRARLSTSAHGSGADPATLSITLSARPLVDDVPFPLRVVREFARAPLRSARVGIIVCGQPPVREFCTGRVKSRGREEG